MFRWREGAEAARRALRLSPRDPASAIYYGVAAYAAYVERDYDEAIRLSREGIHQRNDFAGALMSDNPNYLVWRERMYEGMGMAGVPEG